MKWYIICKLQEKIDSMHEHYTNKAPKIQTYISARNNVCHGLKTTRWREDRLLAHYMLYVGYHKSTFTDDPVMLLLYYANLNQTEVQAGKLNFKGCLI